MRKSLSMCMLPSLGGAAAACARALGFGRPERTSGADDLHTSYKHDAGATNWESVRFTGASPARAMTRGGVAVGSARPSGASSRGDDSPGFPRLLHAAAVNSHKVDPVPAPAL